MMTLLVLSFTCVRHSFDSVETFTGWRRTETSHEHVSRTEERVVRRVSPLAWDHMLIYRAVQAIGICPEI